MSEEMPNKKRIPLWKNKYFLIGSIFLVWMTIFDSNSFWLQYLLWQQKSRLESEEIHLTNQIQSLNEKNKALENDGGRHARENLNMKEENEDIFIVVPPKPKKKSRFQ